MANSTKKTQGVYVSDPTEVKKGGIVKKVVVGSVVTLLFVGIAVSSFFGGKAYQERQFAPQFEQYDQLVIELEKDKSELQQIIDQQGQEIEDLKTQQGQGGGSDQGNENENEGGNGGATDNENDNENGGGNGNGGENNNENDNENNGGNGNDGSGSGEQGGGSDQEQEEILDLTQEEQATIAAGIYTDLRDGINFDATTLAIEGTKLVAEGESNYLQAYISIMEGDSKVMYVVGYEGIDKAEDIANADIRMVKAGTVADIQKYISIEEYVEDGAKMDEAKNFFGTSASIDAADDVFVKITKTNKKGNFVSTVDYIAMNQDAINLGTIVKEGKQYNVSYAELIDMMVQDAANTNTASTTTIEKTISR